MNWFRWRYNKTAKCWQLCGKLVGKMKHLELDVTISKLVKTRYGHNYQLSVKVERNLTRRFSYVTLFIRDYTPLLRHAKARAEMHVKSLCRKAMSL